MKPIVLYREGVVGRAEDAIEIAAVERAGMIHTAQRAGLNRDDGIVVVPRYALWPHVREAIVDIRMLGCVPINDWTASQFVRDAQSWVRALGELTPLCMTWSTYASLGEIAGPVVLKAGEKSRKERWNTHMFARDQQAAIAAMRALLDSGADADEIVVRPYVPLEPLLGKDGKPLVDPNGCPAVVEHRVFVLDGKEIARGFYWTPFADEARTVPNPMAAPVSLISEAVARVTAACQSLRFYTIDVALGADGRWLVVELNDGCQSGLAGCDPNAVYGAIAALEGQQ